MQENYFIDESEQAKKFLNEGLLDYVLELQLKHDIQIIRGADYNYECWIDKDVYHTALTPIGALAFGCKVFKNSQI